MRMVKHLLGNTAAIFLAIFALIGCDTLNASPPGNETATISAVTMQKWSRSCALCHVTGVAGAPRVGIADEWAPRLAGGKQMLMKHTIEGFNNMPPLGYCMSCEREDFASMIDFMLGEP